MVSDGGLGQRVGLVVLMDPQAAPGELFGHDRTVRHKEHGDAVGDHADQHQREHRVVIASDFEGEDNKGERGSRGGAEHGSHGNQSECAGRKMRIGK